MKDIVKLAQTILHQRGCYSGSIDGLAGPMTIKGVLSAIGKKYGLKLSARRAEEYVVMFLQDYALSCGIDPGPVDGWYGRKTAAAVQRLKQIMAERIEKDDDVFLDEADFLRAAEGHNIAVPLIKAVTAVESRGRGFLKSGDPVILFEGHVFWRELKKLGIVPYEAAKGLPEGVLYPTWVNNWYAGGQGEYDRLAAAAKIDQGAALRSASWGLFQIMGFNYAACGYATVHAFVEDMRKHERNHLEAFLRYITKTGLDKTLKARDWTRFAKGYNGPGYAKHGYHTKLEQAYRRYA